MENGKPVQITEAWIQRGWVEIMKETGIREREDAENGEHLRFYDLKHTRLSRLARRTGNVFYLQKISNHKDTKSLEHYIKGEALNGQVYKIGAEDEEENGS